MTRRKGTQPPNAEPRTWAPPPHENALALAIDHNDWERAALLLIMGFARTLEKLPSDTIDDLLAIFDIEEDFNAEVRS